MVKKGRKIALNHSLLGVAGYDFSISEVTLGQ